MREFFSVSFAQLSAAFWQRVEVIEHADWEGSLGSPEPTDGPFAVDLKAARWLFCLARYYEPKTVCEIGTYKGRSAIALAAGMMSGTLWTCDKENDFIVYSPSQVEIRQYRKMTSTEMLSGMTEPIDLFFFDGRIQSDDVAHIKRLSHKSTVYVFDDFEGLEKGVINALKLIDATKIVITGNAKLAVLIPCDSVKLDHQ